MGHFIQRAKWLGCKQDDVAKSIHNEFRDRLENNILINFSKTFQCGKDILHRHDKSQIHPGRMPRPKAGCQSITQHDYRFIHC